MEKIVLREGEICYHKECPYQFDCPGMNPKIINRKEFECDFVVLQKTTKKKEWE